MSENEKTSLRDKILLSITVVMLICALCVECGCNGNSATVKPDTNLDNTLKTSLQNDQAMKEQIESLQGDLTKIQQSISTVVNSIVTQIDQKFETFQDSVSNKIGSVGRDVSTRTAKSTNSAVYGIGLVSVVLLFVLAVIWLFAQILKSYLKR